MHNINYIYKSVPADLIIMISEMVRERSWEEKHLVLQARDHQDAHIQDNLTHGLSIGLLNVIGKSNRTHIIFTY